MTSRSEGQSGNGTHSSCSNAFSIKESLRCALITLTLGGGGGGGGISSFVFGFFVFFLTFASKAKHLNCNPIFEVENKYVTDRIGSSLHSWLMMRFHTNFCLDRDTAITEDF